MHAIEKIFEKNTGKTMAEIGETYPCEKLGLRPWKSWKSGASNLCCVRK